MSNQDPNANGLKDPNVEGYAIVRKAWVKFWDPKKGRFYNSNNSDGSYGDKGIYVVWPVAVMVQAIVDAARIFPDQIKPMLRPAFESFDPYYNPEYHGYNASHHFSGNKDLYYDDNAQVASCFLSAYEITHDRYYLDKAVDNVHFLMTGQERGKFGGVRWHVQKEGSNACTTAEVGLACIRLARFVQNNAPYVQFAMYCCDWLFEKLQDNDKLICDGLEPDGNGVKRNGMKWTYNQGTTLSLACLLFQMTGDQKYRNWAEGLAFAVTDRNTAIFDRDTGNFDVRYYRDYTYFYHLLAEGLADFMLIFGNVSDKKIIDQVTGELAHTLRYVYDYLRDPEDGLYWQSFELNKINKEKYEQFKQLTGENKKYEPRPGERVHSGGDVDSRKMAKVLIGCGGAARIFFQTARVFPKFE
uniref:ARAD1C36168p n=1 Tax=Blastobotrys adeninivorans TaxID=409370 RepID=A0A060T8D9_BLAAD